VEGGGSPSGSRKGFMDKTRVISLCDSGLEEMWKQTDEWRLFYKFILFFSSGSVFGPILFPLYGIHASVK